MTSSQVVQPAGRISEAVAVRAPSAARIPVQLTSFIGREREIAAVRKLLAGVRLLTLTGAGGTGKTRLALEIATREHEAGIHGPRDPHGAQEPHGSPGSPDGIVWIELAPLHDAAMLPEAVASLLQLSEQASRPATQTLTEYLRERRMLLVLDNCEHLVASCAALVERLLCTCPGLRVLATSREALGVPGEVAWLVPPLSMPCPGHSEPAEVAQSEAGQLFVARARAVVPDFAVTGMNAAAVAQICQRLDGIPLAIELAAARLRALSAAQIASRLDDCFRLLTSGTRTAIPRHQTLRATIDWSYALLSAEQRLLLDRLSVFAGSFSLEAAEALCAGGAVARDEVLDLISDLIEKSLVEGIERGDVVRYRLLETVDQYGTERLAARGEADELQRRHAEFFLSLAEQAEPHLTGAQRDTWLEPMKAEEDNFRAALGWTREADTELHLRLIGSLRMLWLSRGSYREARHWFERAITLPDATEPTRGRAAALLTAGALAAMQMENAAGRVWLEESARLWQQFGDVRQQSYAQLYLAATLFDVDLDAAIELLRLTRDRFRALGEPFGESTVLTALGVALQSRSDHRGAIEVLEQALAIARDFGIAHNTALPLQFLASSLFRQGELQRSLGLLREALTALRRDPELVYLSRALWVAAAVLFRQGAALDAVRLFGASAALRERIGASLAGFDRDAYDAAVAAARASLDDADFAATWAEGRRLDAEHAIDLALGVEAAHVVSPMSPPAAALMAAPSVTAAAVERSAPVQLRVRALGPLEVECDGEPLDPHGWRHARPRELLLHLLGHPQGRTREQIGAALWPDATPTQLRNNFHVTIHHLRRVLGHADWVQHDRDRYRINPDLRYEFDAALFETQLCSALQQARTGAPSLERLRAALALYRGDFLENEIVGDWHLERRDHLRRLYVDGMLLLGAGLFDAGDYGEAAEVYHRLTLKEDLHEDAHRRLMMCRARLGDRALAMRHYQRFAQLLRAELQTEPEPQTTALFNRLQRGEPI